MPESEILKDKLILAVDDEEDVLETIQEELSDYPEVRLHTATTFEKGTGIHRIVYVRSGDSGHHGGAWV